MRVNRQIRVPKVRVIDKDGQQLGVMNTAQAQSLADQANLDLVEVAANASPPVCKIVDYGKLRYEQTKKEKEAKKSQHQIKVKEIKIKPNTDTNDLNYKCRHARDFIEKGNKVRLVCVFRGREMQHTEIGARLIKKLVEELSDIAVPEAPPKLLGRNMAVILSPSVKKTIKSNTQASEA